MNRKEISDNFDLKRALDRFAQDYELLNEAIAIFKEEAPKHLAGIKESLGKKELKDASTYAHTLKSECAAVGANSAHDVSWAMEKATGNDDVSRAQEVLPELEKEVKIALEFLPESTEFIVKNNN